MSGSRIDEIIDAVAAAGAGLGTAPNTIEAVWGAGSGKITDPLRSGQTVLAGVPGATNVEPRHWFVLPPRSQRWAYGDATSTEIPWLITGRLYLLKSDLAEAYRLFAGTFANALLAAFTGYSHATLGDVCARVEIASVSFGNGDNFVWLDVTLDVLELVNFGA